jgi:3-oxoacyl-[acyl-carrier protein] reductase
VTGPVVPAEGARVALVTGSEGSIGRRIVAHLRERGMTVLGADLPPAADIPLDVGDAAAVDAAVTRVVREQGRLDVVVNAAGIFGDMTRTDRIDPAVWDHYLRVDLTGPFFVIRAALAHMVPARYGRIVNVASISSTEGGYRQAHYTAAKAGLIGLTRSIALEFATAGITANAVLPGPIDTDKIALVPDDVLEGALAAIPSHRLGRPDDIAHAVAFLADDASGYVNGISLPVDAGAMLLQFKFARPTRYDTEDAG